MPADSAASMGSDMMDAAPGAEGAQGMAPQDDGYIICVHVTGDGQISVGVETAAEEAEEGGESAMDYAPAKNIQDALSQAKAIYDNQGQPAGAGNDRLSVEQAFGQGFSGEAGPGY
jgi:hypothetical protein